MTTNNNMYTGFIFLDLTKAFGTVNHEVLLHKLDHYGIRGQSNNRLRAFTKKTIRQSQRQSPPYYPTTMWSPRVLLWGLFCS